jgi:hypothetical protein
MTKASVISHEDLAATFRYEDSGKLFRLFRGIEWREVDMSRGNTRQGHVKVGFNGKMIMTHRIIYSLFHKIDLPVDMQIDHTNGIRHDNHICNLELVTHRGNQQNRVEHREGKLVGCSLDKRRDLWRAKIQINDKSKFLGYFATEQEAHNAYVVACDRLSIEE